MFCFSIRDFPDGERLDLWLVDRLLLGMDAIPPDLAARIAASQEAIEKATRDFTRGEITVQEAKRIAGETAELTREIREFKRVRGLHPDDI